MSVKMKESPPKDVWIYTQHPGPYEYGSSFQPSVFLTPCLGSKHPTLLSGSETCFIIKVMSQVLGNQGHVLDSLDYLELPDPSLGPDLWKECLLCSYLPAQPTAA